MKILAHRGWWLDAGEKNTEAAFRRAFENGFGVETDVRDQNGVLRIAHDMPVGDGIMDLRGFLDLHNAYAGSGTVALNIKADGLQESVRAALDDAAIRDVFCFDMAVPDALGYLRRGFATYTRHSDLEPVPPYYEEADGVWLDAFYSDWITPDVVRAHLDAGKSVALVSPELHGRDPTAAWSMWATLRGQAIAICTDRPHLAAEHWGAAETRQ
jgi:glycerophosphoryl diester phosphodiesterase